jgi:hypothetical protein
VQRGGGGGRRGAWIAVGVLLLAGGGIGVGVAMTSGGGGEGAERAASTTPEPTREMPPEPGSAHEVGGSPLPPPKPVQPEPALAGAPCPTGQLRTDDTRGQCCWAGQAWSTAKKRCVGAPTCPPGTRASGEQCVAAMAEADPRQAKPETAPDSTPVEPLAAAPAIQLSAASFPPGASIDIRFAQAIRSTPARRAWVTVTAAGSPETSYGTWKFVDDRARHASLEAPPKPGAYEVRLHTEYPAKPFHVARAVPFAVAGPAEAPPDSPAPSSATPPSGQRFALASATVRTGGKAEVRFPGPLRAAPGEQFWITVIEAGSSDTGWGKWEYVPAGARAMSLAVPDKEGAYEVRLHANYPKKSANVVFRAALQIAP